MQAQIYKVYVLLDGDDIAAVNSSAFLSDVTSWTQIDEGIGDKYHHAQGNYFDKPLTTDDGIYRYKLINGEVVEKAESEIAAEVEALPPPPPTLAEEISEIQETLNALLGVE